MRLLILLCLICPNLVIAETSLWKISKGDAELFIGGTIHVLSLADYPLPDEFARAYDQAEMIVLETDLAAMASQNFQQQLIQRVVYEEGRTLADELSTETYQALIEYTHSAGIDIASLNHFKPPMVMISLLMMKLNELGMGEAGVDRYFSNKATKDNKTLGYLESAEVQLDVIASMGKGYEDEMIQNTIDEMKKLSGVMNDMKQAWRLGNMSKLAQIGILPMQKDYPHLYDLLLVNRNNNWIPKIEQMLTTPEVELVLVGALHLAAREGLIFKLRELGYKVEFY